VRLPTSVEMSEPPGRPARTVVGVMTVDDQAVFRQAAREVIDATVGFEPLGEATCGEEALALADEVSPDLVLIDVRMPGIDGLETARRLNTAHPAATIVLISTETLDDLPSSVRSCGAVAFVRKQDFGPPMLRRIWAEHSGRL
jgi:two-component system, NarL family, invasion response regulator UvrY